MKRYFLASLLVFLFAMPISAGGSFSTGIMFGVDSGSSIPEDLNRKIRAIKGGDPGAEIEELPTYNTPAITLNFRYLYDRLMLQLGWEYAATPFLNETGSVRPSAGVRNEIEIRYSRFTFPFTMAFVMPAGRRTRFYLGGGVNISFVMLKIEQSNPGIFSSIPDKKSSYSAYIPGFHMKFGGEVVLTRNYSVSVEYARYMGRKSSVESESGSSEVQMGVDTYEISCGVNYTVDTGL